MPQKSRFQTMPLPSGNIFSFVAPVLLKWGREEGGKDEETANNQAQHKKSRSFRKSHPRSALSRFL